MIQLDVVLKDLSGAAVKDGEKEVTLASVICAACINVLRGDDEMPSGEKLALYRIAQAAVKGGEQEITLEHRVLIKDRVRRMYSTLIYGQVHDLLEP